MPDSLTNLTHPIHNSATTNGIDWNYIITLLIIMLLTGLIGGYANYLNTPKEDRNLLRSIMMGIVATIAIPLFLKVVDSNILNQTKGDVLNYFIYAGCCVLAAFYSARFLEGLSSRILQNIQEKVDRTSQVVDAHSNQIEETTKKADMALDNQLPDLEMMEPETPSEISADEANSRSLTGETSIVSPQEKVEAAFLKYRTVLHTAETLSKATGLNTDIIKLALIGMEQAGKINKVMHRGQEVYHMMK